MAIASKFFATETPRHRGKIGLSTNRPKTGIGALGEWRTVSAVSVYATRCDAHVNRLDICGTFAETPQHHLFFGEMGKNLCASVAIIFVDAIALGIAQKKISPQRH